VKDILSDDVVPPLSKPWKQAWGYMKGLFVKEEQELEELPHDERKRKWQIWKKEKSQSKEE
jgi:hemoglobin-like flavoprotein